MVGLLCLFGFFFFFFNDTATTEIYTLSLHDALPISSTTWRRWSARAACGCCGCPRSEEHTSELQSLAYLVCRLLLEKKKLPKWHTNDVSSASPPIGRPTQTQSFTSTSATCPTPTATF